MICDGDSKSIVRVNNEQPYGSDVVIEVIYKITFVISYLFFIIIFFDNFRSLSAWGMSKSDSGRGCET